MLDFKNREDYRIDISEYYFLEDNNDLYKGIYRILLNNLISINLVPECTEQSLGLNSFIRPDDVHNRLDAILEVIGSSDYCLVTDDSKAGSLEIVQVKTNLEAFTEEQIKQSNIDDISHVTLIYITTNDYLLFKKEFDDFHEQDGIYYSELQQLASIKFINKKLIESSIITLNY